ncbi:hypothetical protein B0H14DRAFT_3886543 [Mycena olivaceomarginata]|nr:hypothetical protein B0H14DRAFT_3886543 [Mycena olivaceomarginata]
MFAPPSERNFPRLSPDEDLRPTQAQHTAASGSCPKAKDFDDVTQEIISLAITEYRVLLSGKYAFPDPTIELDYLRRAWTKAFKELEVAIESTPTISKLGRGSHLCGELKTIVKPLAEFMYEFASGQNKKAIAANRQRSEELKENLTFTSKCDIKGRKGIYRHPLLPEGRQRDVVLHTVVTKGLAIRLYQSVPKRSSGSRTDCERDLRVLNLLGTFGWGISWTGWRIRLLQWRGTAVVLDRRSQLLNDFCQLSGNVEKSKNSSQSLPIEDG